MTDDTESWLPYAGIGGLTVCCVALEVLGGVAVVSGLAAAIGLSTGLTYAVVIGLGGLLAALLVAGYQQLEG
jgi:MFS superfamily sulfate permease-like transporter